MIEKKRIVDWANSLKNISDDLWFKPFHEGAWGIADVISHFISWDKFVIENRISYLVRKECIPQITVDVEMMNNDASNYARSGIIKEDLISELISVREELINLIGGIQSDQFHQPLPGRENITLSEYFNGLIDHENHHKEQIESHMKNWMD